MIENAYDKAIETFRIHNGLLRTQQAIDEGIAPRTLYQMRKQAQSCARAGACTGWQIPNRVNIMTWCR